MSDTEVKTEKVKKSDLENMIAGAVEKAVTEVKAENEKLKVDMESLKDETERSKAHENAMPFFEEYKQAKRDDYSGIAVNTRQKQYSDEWFRDTTPEGRFKAMLKGLRHKDTELIIKSHALSPGPIGKDLNPIRTYSKDERMAIAFEVEKDLSSTGTSASMIPVDYMRVLINCLYFDNSNLLSKFRTRFTQLPETRTPTLTSGSTVHWVGEGETKPESDPVFGEYVWDVKKQVTRTDVTEEMLEDSDPSVAQVIRDDHVRAMTLDSLYMFFYGDGVNNPRGIDLDIPAANTIFVGGVFNGDDFHRLKCAVRQDYRMGGWFYANDCIWCIAERFKDSTGQYIWKQGFNDMLTEKEPETMIGYPYYRGVDETMPISFAQTGTGTGAYGNIFFGNPYNYMMVVRTQWKVKYDGNYDFDKNIDSFITESRWDARMLCDSFSKLEGVRCTETGI